LLLLALGAIGGAVIASMRRGGQDRPDASRASTTPDEAATAPPTDARQSPLGRRFLPSRGRLVIAVAAGLALVGAVSWWVDRDAFVLRIAQAWAMASTPVRLQARDVSLQMVVLGILGLLLFLWLIPFGQIALTRGLAGEKRFAAEQEARKTWTQIVAGAFVLVTWYQTWSSTQVAQEAQITNRFSQAIEQLGASADDKSIGIAQVDQRVGGVYALERLTRDSLVDYERTLNMLSLYVRRHASLDDQDTAVPATTMRASGTCPERPRKPQPRDDVQAVLYIIGRRPADAPVWYFDISGTSLRGACLIRGNFRQVIFSDADLSQAVLAEAVLLGANLSRARLDGAQLVGSYLGRAELRDASLVNAGLRWVQGGEITAEEAARGVYAVQMRRANLAGADLREAGLSQADLRGAILDGADLRGAVFQHADLRGASLQERPRLQGTDFTHADLSGTKLQGADLRGATLESANLQDADLKDACLAGATLPPWLKGANLADADLQGADVSEVTDLTWEQISVAIISKETRLPAYLGGADPPETGPSLGDGAPSDATPRLAPACQDSPAETGS
jgi:uncharacterized protein YjbI with pentapeptide repeats